MPRIRNARFSFRAHGKTRIQSIFTSHLVLGFGSYTLLAVVNRAPAQDLRASGALRMSPRQADATTVPLTARGACASLARERSWREFSIRSVKRDNARLRSDPRGPSPA